MQGASSSSNASTNDLFVDEFYFSALYDEEDIFPISDEKYAEQIQLQEALMSSSIMSTTLGNEETNEVLIIEESRGKKKKEETSESTGSFCKICMEAKPTEDMIRNNKRCTHLFCSDCMSSYLAAKIQENISTVKCPHPNCRAVLEPSFCRSIVPVEVFGRWENALCENLILGSQKFYCPFKDCSAMLVDDGDEVVTSSECPTCRRLFCAQCKVSWHAGMECREFQREKEGGREKDDDVLLMELAKNERWRRCPRSKFYVEKVDGCLHISCRCGYDFCYGCGSDWDQHHGCPVR